MDLCSIIEGGYKLLLFRLRISIHGVVDGPPPWQISMLHYLARELAFTPSRHDDNFHIDDLFITSAEFIKWSLMPNEDRFGTEMVSLTHLEHFNFRRLIVELQTHMVTNSTLPRAMKNA